jgi:hypothetical protein
MWIYDSGKNSFISKNDAANISGLQVCYLVSVGNGWDIVSKYIETQDVHHTKNASYSFEISSGVCNACDRPSHARRGNKKLFCPTAGFILSKIFSP